MAKTASLKNTTRSGARSAPNGIGVPSATGQAWYTGCCRAWSRPACHSPDPDEDRDCGAAMLMESNARHPTSADIQAALNSYRVGSEYSHGALRQVGGGSDSGVPST